MLPTIPSLNIVLHKLKSLHISPDIGVKSFPAVYFGKMRKYLIKPIKIYFPLHLLIHYFICFVILVNI